MRRFSLWRLLKTIQPLNNAFRDAASANIKCINGEFLYMFFLVGGGLVGRSLVSKLVAAAVGFKRGNRLALCNN